MTQEQTDFILDANNYYRMGIKLMLNLQREIDELNEKNNIPDDMHYQQCVIAWSVIGKHLSHSMAMSGFNRKETERIMIEVFKETKEK